jgi:putative membrane protein
MNKKLIDAFYIFIRGLCMGSADIVPGVSGGTIALITGIYERLIGAISNIKFIWIKPLLRGDLHTFKTKLLEDIDFELFIPLLLGIAIAFLSLAKVINFCLNVYTAYTFAFFLGLILASAYILFTELDKVTVKNFIIVVIFTVLTYIFVGLNPIAANHSLPIIFISAIIAICAMILPGISGSFLLLLLGQYQYMLGCLSTLKLPDIITFVVGALIGILGFSRVIKWLLEHYRSATVSALIGIMVGTVRLPYAKMAANFAGTSLIGIIILMVIGFVLIVVLEKQFKMV